MTTLYTQSFTGTDANPIGSPWTTVEGGGLQRVSNQLRGSGSVASAYVNSVTPPADQWARGVVGYFNDHSGGVAVRMTAGDDMYLFACENNNTYLYRVNGGTYTTLVSDFTTVVVGNTMEIRVQGNVITGYVNGINNLSYTDTSGSALSAAGHFGAAFYQSGVGFTSFVGGDFTPSGATLTADTTNVPVTATQTFLIFGISVDVYWTRVPGNAGYRVKYGTTSGGPYTTGTIDSPTDQENTTLTGLSAAGTGTYYWVVAALANGVEQQYSNQAVFTVTVPPLIADATNVPVAVTNTNLVVGSRGAIAFSTMQFTMVNETIGFTYTPSVNPPKSTTMSLNTMPAIHITMNPLLLVYTPAGPPPANPPYPVPAVWPQLLTSVPKNIDDVSLDRAVDGTVRGRGFFPTSKKTFTVRHVLTSAQKAQLDTYYETNRLQTFTFVWGVDGQSYTVVYGGPPTYSLIVPNLFAVEVLLLQT